MAEHAGSQLALRMLDGNPPFSESSSVCCSRVDPNHPAYAASVDDSGVLRYVFFGEGGLPLIVGAFELAFSQPGPPGEPSSWLPVRRRWSGFAFLPRCASQELLLCRANSNKLLYTRLPASAQQPQDVYHFGSHIGNITAFHVQPDGDRVLSGCDQGVLKLWSLSTGKQLASNNSAHRGPITGLCSIGTNRFASGGRDGTILVWDTASRALGVVHSLSVACASPVSSLEVFDGLLRLEAGTAVVMPWRRRAAGAAGGALEPPPDPCAAAEGEPMQPRTLLAAGTASGGIYVWSCVADRWVEGCGTAMCQVCVDHATRGAPVAALAFSLGGEVLAAASSAPRHLPQNMLPDLRDSSQGIVRVYDTARWRCQEVLEVDGGVPGFLQFVPGEQAKAGGDGLPRLLLAGVPRRGPRLLPSWAPGASEDDGREDGPAVRAQMGPPQVEGLLEGDPIRTAALLEGPWEPDLPSRGTTPCSSPSAAARARAAAEALEPDEQPRLVLPRGPTSAAPVALGGGSSGLGELDEDGDRTPVPRSLAGLQGPRGLQGPPEGGIAPAGLELQAEALDELTPQPRGLPPAPAGGLFPEVRVAPAPATVPEAKRTGENGSTLDTGIPPLPPGTAISGGRAAGRPPLVIRHIKPPGSAAFAPPTAAARGPRKAPAAAEANIPAPAPLPDNARFVADTAASTARKETQARASEGRRKAEEAPAEDVAEPRTAVTAESLPAAAGINSTRIIQGKISRVEAEEFPAEEALPAVRAAAAGEAAREAAPLGSYSGLVPIDDRVSAPPQRSVAKQLDSRWVASRQKAPRMKDLWGVEDRFPGATDTELNLPIPPVTREEVAAALLSVPYF